MLGKARFQEPTEGLEELKERVRIEYLTCPVVRLDDIARHHKIPKATLLGWKNAEGWQVQREELRSRKKLKALEARVGGLQERHDDMIKKIGNHPDEIFLADLLAVQQVAKYVQQKIDSATNTGSFSVPFAADCASLLTSLEKLQVSLLKRLGLIPANS